MVFLNNISCALYKTMSPLSQLKVMAINATYVATNQKHAMRSTRVLHGPIALALSNVCQAGREGRSI